MSDYALQEICRSYLGMGIQNWGQGADKREAATRKYVEAAGLTFGTTEADEWLSGVLGRLRRGKFETEIEQLMAAVSSRAALAIPASNGEVGS